MDDLDDILGDLLSEDTKPQNKRQKTPTARDRGGKPKSNDDDFYSSIAAEAQSESSISEADAAEMAKSLAGLDDLDDGLFGGKKPATAESKKSDSGRASGKVKKKESFDFDDDDPLAGLLSDDEGDTQPRRKSIATLADKAIEESPAPRVSALKDDQESVSSRGSRRLEIERPPTRSGSGSDKKKVDDDLFGDDDDPLGLESPKPTKKNTRERSSESTGRNFMDDLMTTGASKLLERPGTGERREFKFDQKKPQTKPQKEDAGEDFSFGGYMPSAVSQPGSRPSSHRSVRFEEDDLFSDKPRGSSAPARRRRDPASFLEDSVANDDRDWLDMASNAPMSTSKDRKSALKSDDRPKSEGSLRDKPPKPNESRKLQTNEPESSDWLGLSRLGSPDNKAVDTNEKEESLSIGGTAKSGDDFLGLSGTGRQSRSSRRSTPKFSEDGDKKLSKQDDESGTSWLGLKENKKEQVDDWLKNSPRINADASGDYKSFGDELDGDFLGPSMDRRKQRSVDDLFSTPAKHESPSAFNDRKRTSRSADQTRPVTAPPEQGGLPVNKVNPESTQEKARMIDASESKGDGGDDLMATLQAAKQRQSSRSPERSKITVPTTPAVLPSNPAIQTQMQPTMELTSLPTGTFDMSSMMQKQQEAIQKQQQMLAEQQQQQQIELQKQMMQQQEQQMKAQAAMQEQQMKAMQAAAQQQMTMPRYPLGMMPGMQMFSMPGFGDNTSEVKIHKLEMEREHLNSMMSALKVQHAEEVKMLEDSHMKKVSLLEDSFKSRETRLKEENALLSDQNLEKIKKLESEKSDFLAIQNKTHEEWEKGKLDEIARLKEQHRQTLSDMRQDHEEAMHRMKKAKEIEIETLTNTQAHTRELQSVIGLISENAKGLTDLQDRVEGKHQSSITDREKELKTRNDQLKVLQERLERQQHETQEEQARLHGLVKTLEAQLTEQARKMEEDRWQTMQERNKVQAQQAALERERESLREQNKRERTELQSSREQLLQEERSILSQLHEERRALADERAQFNMSQKMKQESDQREALKNSKTAVEVESGIRAINEEKMRLSILNAEARREQEQLSLDKNNLEEERQTLRVEKQKLEQAAMQVKKRAAEINDMVEEAVESRKKGESALSNSKRVESEQIQRLQQIDGQIKVMRAKEKQIAQERLTLAKERQNLENLQNNVLCVSCKTPIRDANTLLNQPVSKSVHPTNGFERPVMGEAASDLFAALDPDTQAQVSNLSNVAAAIEMDKSVRLWKIAAEKDREYLEEESYFLEGLKYTPYHS